MTPEVNSDWFAISNRFEKGILIKQERRNTKQRNKEHHRNSGTPQSSGGTTEHTKISTEHQHNISGTPRNNGAI